MNIINNISLKASLIIFFINEVIALVFLKEEIEMKDRDAAQTTGNSYAQSLTQIHLNKSL